MNNIKELIENKLGITTIENYNEYKKRIWETGVSLKEVEELSPDNIDSGEFWKYCDETPEWKFDTVAFGQSKDSSPEKSNSQNFNVAVESGVFSRILMHRGCEFNVLDIGAGFGMLKKELQRYAPFTQYYGVDVHPKFEGVIKVNDCILPPSIMSMKFGYVFACNVFQHLSLRQRKTYYEQVAKICNGYFVLTLPLNMGDKKLGFLCKDDGKRYGVHYGQFTPYQDYDEAIQDLTLHFNITSIQRRLHDDHYCFHLTSKLLEEKPKEKNEK